MALECVLQFWIFVFMVKTVIPVEWGSSNRWRCEEDNFRFLVTVVGGDGDRYCVGRVVKHGETWVGSILEDTEVIMYVDDLNRTRVGNSFELLRYHQSSENLQFVWQRLRTPLDYDVINARVGDARYVASYRSKGHVYIGYLDRSNMCIHATNDRLRIAMRICGRGIYVLKQIPKRTAQHENCINGWGTDYTGDISTTRSGLQCQTWTAQLPSTHRMNVIGVFPDASTDDAQNFCRNPDGYVTPWCYTTEPEVTRWESCDIPQCADTGNDVINSVTTNDVIHSVTINANDFNRVPDRGTNVDGTNYLTPFPTHMVDTPRTTVLAFEQALSVSGLEIWLPIVLAFLILLVFAIVCVYCKHHRRNRRYHSAANRKALEIQQGVAISQVGRNLNDSQAATKNDRAGSPAVPFHSYPAVLPPPGQREIQLPTKRSRRSLKSCLQMPVVPLDVEEDFTYEEIATPRTAKRNRKKNEKLTKHIVPPDFSTEAPTPPMRSHPKLVAAHYNIEEDDSDYVPPTPSVRESVTESIVPHLDLSEHLEVEFGAIPYPEITHTPDGGNEEHYKPMSQPRSSSSDQPDTTTATDSDITPYGQATSDDAQPRYVINEL